MKKVRIRLADISKSYYSETAVTQALRKINLTFREGEFVAITGESGSGKSTLLNIIGGMDTFDDGEMYIDGEPTFQYDEQDWEDYRRNKIGYVFQDYSLVGHYSALDNIMSALLIMDQDLESAKKVAEEYLNQVGLEGFGTHKASELSSGQKQRLSIARALAKDTGIIVADEPTGNLDSETGNQIIRLLKELSKDRLVIMVTHNYDQVEPYATRKIRLHDGEIISDVSGTGENELLETVWIQEENLPPTEQADAGLKRRRNRVAAHFAKLNRKTQKGRAVLFTSFLFVICIVSFLFIGELYQYADDTNTKIYSQSAFYREDDTRLVARHSDGSAITAADVEQISALSNVVAVDSCDVANDINFYMEENVDYEYIYGVQRNWGEREEVVRLSFLKEDRFVMSEDCIDETDLKTGHLPESRNEVVLYSEDESVLGTSVTTYFTSRNLWGQDQYYCTDVTIVGILKEESSQVYFSKDLCNMLAMHMDSGYFRLYYAWDTRIKDYSKKTWFIPVIADDLTGAEVRLSALMGEEDKPIGETLFHFEDIDEAGNEDGNAIEQNVSVLEDGNSHSSLFLEVSQEFYDTYYQKKSTQASVYLTSYAKTDSVTRKLNSLGYQVISSYRVSMTDYDEELVANRMTIIGICSFGLLALLLAEVLILRSLMKIRIKDYFVLKFIGMKLQMIQRISYYEMGAYSVTAMILTILAMWILRLAGVEVITDMMWYVRPDAYLVFILYNMLLCLLTVAAFNHLLKGRLKS